MRRRLWLGIALLAAALLLRLAISGEPVWPGADAARSWLHGTIPWWDAEAGTGAPTTSLRPSPAFLVPFAWLLAVPHGAVPMAMLLRSIAGFAAWALLRELRLAAVASAAGAMLFALGTADPGLPGAAFLPLLVLGVERIGSGRRGGGIALVAGLVGVSAAGAPVAAWLGMLFAAGWAVLRLFGAPPEAGGARAARLLLHAGAGTLISAPILWQALSDDTLARHGGTAPETPHTLPWVALAGLLVACLTLGLGLGLGLGRVRQQRALTWALATWLVLGVGKALALPVLDFLMAIVAPMPAGMFVDAAAPGWWLAFAVLASMVVETGGRARVIATGLAVAAAILLGGDGGAFGAGGIGAGRLDSDTAAALRSGIGLQRVAVLAAGIAPARDLPGIAVIDPGNPLASADLLRLAALGVARVAIPAGTSPFARTVILDPPLAPDGPALELAAGQSVTGVFPASAMPGGVVERAGVEIGTYAGSASGRIDLALCREAVCVSGQADLAGAADNRTLFATLAPPLTVPAGGVLRWRVTHVGVPADHAVAVWMHPDPAGATEGPLPGRIPRIALETRIGATAVTLLHRGPRVDVVAVPDPAPYFEIAGGPCGLSVASRTELQSVCEQPAHLTRRERFKSGWRATLDGVDLPIAAAAQDFQTVALPAGASAVRFAYAPPGRRWLAGASALGLLLWGVELVRDRRAEIREEVP